MSWGIGIGLNGSFGRLLTHAIVNVPVAIFDVPLAKFKRGGEILLPYTYSWDEGERGQIIAKENGYVRRYETVEHYLRFVGE